MRALSPSTQALASSSALDSQVIPLVWLAGSSIATVAATPAASPTSTPVRRLHQATTL